jgi:hypothetical protein
MFLRTKPATGIGIGAAGAKAAIIRRLAAHTNFAPTPVVDLRPSGETQPLCSCGYFASAAAR